ncbi:hypothetical protein IJT17_04580 [bacterium]|nr:hypothetical protein [bacterium]
MAAGLISSRRTYGTTLIELLTASSIFLLLIGVIMSFYISGARVTRQQDQHSETLRRGLRIVNRIEVLLSYSHLLWAGRDYSEQESQVLLFVPLADNPLASLNGISWSRKAAKLCVDISDKNEQRIVHTDISGNKRLIGTLGKGESIEFACGASQVRIVLKLLNSPVAGEHAPEENEIHTQERAIPIYNGEIIN